jgi:hypothetical protein
MDEAAYRQAITTPNLRYCPFEKSVLTRCAACMKAERHSIAEREIIACNNAEAHELCIELRDLFRHNFTFALGKLHIDGPLPHAQEMRMQCGGLKGLQFEMDGNDVVADVNALLVKAQQQFDDLANLPYSHIVRWAMTYYKAR